VGASTIQYFSRYFRAVPIAVPVPPENHRGMHIRKHMAPDAQIDLDGTGHSFLTSGEA
jgi:hypothetical protein